MNANPAILQATTGQSMILTGVTAHGVVRGLLFELTVEQSYRNPTAKSLEVVYTFPLPYDATLLDVEIQIGGRQLSAVVVEKKAAEARYENALAAGDTPLMLERSGNGLCTLNLGNLLASETATIRYRYGQLLRFAQGHVRLAIPTVIAPRYGEPQDGGLVPHQVPCTDFGAEYPFSLTLELQGEIARGELSSPSHPLKTEATDEGVRVWLDGTAYLDRDFVLLVNRLSGHSLTVAGQDGERAVVLASYCTEIDDETPTLPLAIKLLVDCSGSMAGDSIHAARRALLRILSALHPADRFSLSRFGSTLEHDTDGLVAAHAEAVEFTSEQVTHLQADLGGTELAAALSAVMQLGSGDRRADVLLITDGQAWDDGRLADEALATRQRVFVVAIGSAPAEGVLQPLAERTGGATEFVAAGQDVSHAVVRMFARMRGARLVGASTTWPVAPRWETPLPFGPFAGETIHVFAGFEQLPSGQTTLTLHATGSAPLRPVAVPLPSRLATERTLARMAAAHRLPTLSRAEQLQLALEYGLLTEQTNLFVVHVRDEQNKSRDLPELARVAQMHAAGWHGIGRLKDCVETIHMSKDFSYTRVDVLRRDSRQLSAGWKEAVDRMDSRATAQPAAPKDRKSHSLHLAEIYSFIENLRPTALPKSIRDLQDSLVPTQLGVLATTLVAGGHSEEDVIRALLEALGKFAASSDRAAHYSRQLLRALSRQFADGTKCQELRRLVADQFSQLLATAQPVS